MTPRSDRQVVAGIGSEAAARAHRSAAPSVPPARQPAATVRPDARPTGPGAPGAGVGDPTQRAESALRRLEQLRSQAYARRSTSLLTQVYSAEALARQDAATLERVVPAGCALQDLHSRFTGTRANWSGTRLEVTTQTRLLASSLRCPGTPDRAVPGSTPMALRIVLSPGTSGYRIAAQERL